MQPHKTFFLFLVLLLLPSVVFANDFEHNHATNMIHQSFNTQEANNENVGDIPIPCMSCVFLHQFSGAFLLFSATVFVYFKKAFFILVPVLFGTWIAFRASALFVQGGANGKAFLYSIAKTTAVFFFTTLVLLAPSQDTSTDSVFSDAGFFWEQTGPGIFAFGMGIGAEMRNSTLTTLEEINGNGNAQNANEALACLDGVVMVDRRPPTGAGETTLDAMKAVVQTACMVERVHILAGSANLAAIQSVFTTPSSIFGVASKIVVFLVALFGLILVALSAFWFIFLVLDIFVKSMVITMATPVMTIMLVFPIARKGAWRIARGLVSIPFYAVGISLVSTLSYFLVINTVEVYEATREVMKATKYAGTPLTLNALEGVNQLQKFSVFTQRLGLSKTSPQSIPASLAEPWIIYQLLCVLAIFSLGKKIMTIITNILPDQGDQNMGTSMADNAFQQAGKAANFAAKAAATTAVLTPKAAILSGKVGLWAGRKGVNTLAGIRGMKTGSGDLQK